MAQYPPGSIAKLTAILNANHAPWLSCEFRRQKQEALNLFVQAHEHDMSMWGELRENLAFDQCLHPDEVPEFPINEFLDLDTFRCAGEYVHLDQPVQVSNNIPKVEGIKINSFA